MVASVFACLGWVALLCVTAGFGATSSSLSCLPWRRYVVLSNMLSLSQINPFDSQEAKVYVLVTSARR